MAGTGGEVELVAVLSDACQSRRTMIVAALGDAQGQAGPSALRRVLADPKATVDTVCAALLALAKRDGVQASPELAAHLRHRSGSVRSYAMRGLAVVGDDRAWAAAMNALCRMLDRPTPTHLTVNAPARFTGIPSAPLAGRSPGLPPADMPSLSAMFEAMVAITYLVRHLNDAADTRRGELVSVLRARFDRLHPPEQAFLIQYWRGCQPNGPDPKQLDNLDPAPFRAWARDPLFGPVF
jgi:hypothetical protein